MYPVETRQPARSLPLPRLWWESSERTSRERLHSWKVVAIATDVLMLTLAAAAFGLVPSFPPVEPAAAAGFSILVMALFGSRGLYAARLRPHFVDDLPHIVSATAAAAMAVIAGRVLLGGEPDAVQSVHYWLFAAGCLAVGRVPTHYLQLRARRRGVGERPTLIVGAGRLGHLIAQRLMDRPEIGLRPIGFLDKEPLEIAGGAGLPVLGASWDLDRTIDEQDVQHVIVTFSTAPHHVLLALTRRCWQRGVSVSVVPRMFEVEGKRVTVEHLGGIPLIAVDATDPKSWQFRMKYAVERLVAGLAVLLLLPLLAVVALAVRVSMGAPVFYRQPRVGRDGHVFDMLKFRTMDGRPEDSGEADVDWAIREIAGTDPLARDNGNGNGNARANGAGGQANDDGRVGASANGADRSEAEDRRTPLGRLLRNSSLDELPQLLNVLRGDMSLIGPRPERASYVERFEGSVYRYRDRHRVKSGITGWAQVNGLRGKTSLAERVEWDNYYVENWSPWLDLKIVLLTIGCVLRGQTGE